MGWNQLQIRENTISFRSIAPEPFVYFAHSYYLPVSGSGSGQMDEPRASALADYGFQFVAAIEQMNIRGVQFHPEKSGQIGLQMLRNFAELNSSNDQDNKQIPAKGIQC